MKTIIFLCQRHYQRYTLNRFFDNKNYRLVAVLTHEQFSKFPESHKKFFSNLYSVNNINDENFYERYTLDYNDAYKIVQNEIEIAKGPENCIIICNDEHNLLIAGKLRDEFDIKGAGYNQLQVYRDKMLMKKKLQNAGIRVPRNKYIDIPQVADSIEKNYNKLISTLGDKFVIKTTSGSSSLDTHIICSLDDFIKMAEQYQNTQMQFEAEEYIDGILYHCDSLMQNGKLVFSVASEHLNPNLDFFQGKNLGSIPLQEEDLLQQRIIGFTNSALNALGCIDGPTHLEVFHTPQDELIFLEVGARTSGMFTVPNFQKMFGINLFDINLKIQLEENVKLEKLRVDCFSFFAFMPLPAGKIVELCEPKIRSDYDLTWLVKKGDIVLSQPKTFLDMSGYMYVYNSDYSALKEDFNYIRNYYKSVKIK